MNNELSKEQIERQNHVDSHIYSLIGELIPQIFQAESGDWGEIIPYDLQIVSDVREKIQEIIKTALKIEPNSDEAERFDLEFYPFFYKEVEF